MKDYHCNKLIESKRMVHLGTAHNMLITVTTMVPYYIMKLMEQHALKKHEPLFENQHLLLLRDIWWSNF
jgi:hypothetical protein